MLKLFSSFIPDSKFKISDLEERATQAEILSKVPVINKNRRKALSEAATTYLNNCAGTLSHRERFGRRIRKDIISLRLTDFITASMEKKKETIPTIVHEFTHALTRNTVEGVNFKTRLKLKNGNKLHPINDFNMIFHQSVDREKGVLKPDFPSFLDNRLSSYNLSPEEKNKLLRLFVLFAKDEALAHKTGNESHKLLFGTDDPRRLILLRTYKDFADKIERLIAETNK